MNNLWHFTRLRIESRDSIPLPSYLYVSFAHPGIIRFILKKGDIVARMTMHCVGALIINKIATDITARPPVNGVELEYLAAVLGTTNQDVTNLLGHPGAVQIANMVYFMSIYDVIFCTPTSHVLDVVQQTLRFLSQALPAPLNAHMQLVLTESLLDFSQGWFKLIYHLHIYYLKDAQQ